MYGLTLQCELTSNPLVKLYVYMYMYDLYNNPILCIVCLPTKLYALYDIAERT